MPAEEWTSFDVDGKPVRAHLSLPGPEIANGCGVVILHGSSGLEPGFMAFPRRLAELGYASILPDMFHRRPDFMELPPLERIHSLTWDGAQDDLGGALAVLRKHGVRHAAVLGYCFGGALALMAPATMEFETGVLYYAHELFVPWGTGPIVPVDLITRLRVPILAHSGTNDTNPSPADMKRLDEALTGAGVTHQFYLYEGCPHGFAVNNGRPNFNEMQALIANDRTIAWFERHLLKTGVTA